MVGQERAGRSQPWLILTTSENGLPVIAADYIMALVEPVVRLSEIKFKHALKLGHQLGIIVKNKTTIPREFHAVIIGKAILFDDCPLR